MPARFSTSCRWISARLLTAVMLLCPVIFLSADFSSLQINVPEPGVPVYDRLKDLHITTSLVADSKAKVTIVTPYIYMKEAKAIRKSIKNITGTNVPLVSDTDPSASVPLKGNLILLGNRSTNKAINALYDMAYTFLDIKYPGTGGFVVRSLHNPFGDGKNVIFAGGSDPEGVSLATANLIKLIQSYDEKNKKHDLSLGYLCNIKLGKGYELPGHITEARIWEASEMYKSSGYFGWNIVSKNMALYYMTGEDKYREEFLRLAFPDKAAIKEIEELDGERIENKNDPLSGPYHYSAHMMIELWDLIEESPAFTDAQRLRITNAFARQLPHRVIEGVYNRTIQPLSLGDRHSDWSAFALYVLGRYFMKDYPGAVWQHCMKAADLYFSALKNTYWTGGINDHLFWFTSYYDPMINYLILSGTRDSTMLKNLRRGLNTQEILSTGLSPDWGVRASSLNMLNKAAYLLNDGRWLYYREKIRLDTDSLRLGQSFWPGHELKPIVPLNLSEKWNIQFMPHEMQQSRRTGFTPEQSFRWGSYRSDPGPASDYILIKGYNGAGRNPYHTYDILELRLNGNTIIKGYGNQVLSSADGMVEPKVAMDAALLFHDVLPNFVTVVAQVPDLPFINWKRSVVMRKKQYVLVADEIDFRTTSNNLLTETQWEMPDAKWIQEDNCIKLQNSKDEYQLRSSDNFDVSGKNVITMKWHGSVKNGDSRTFFHIIGPGSSLAAIRLSENSASLNLPQPALAVSGKYNDIEGSLVLLTENSLFGHGLIKAGTGQQIISADKPAAVDWDFNSGILSIVNNEPLKLSFAVTDRTPLIDGKSSGIKEGGVFTVNLTEGRHEIKGAQLPPALLEEIKNLLASSGKKAESLAPGQNEKPAPVTLPSLNMVMQTKTGVKPVESIAIPSPLGDMMCTASGKTIYIFSSEGREIRRMETTADVRVLRWWNEPKLLLAGCTDEKVMAFSESGQKMWEFTSVMDQAVYEAGKQYWFKSAHPGIYGLYSGYFDNGKSRAFVGSACTLEILDESGKLVKRLPTFWGPGRQFLIVNAEDGSKNLLVARWHNDRENMAIINSNKMEETGRGYSSVPPGHTFVNGWDCMNRFDNYLIDLDGDKNREVVSAINGTWNRISVYTESGKPLFNTQIGPGSEEPRSNIGMMDAGDINNDGKAEIVFCLSSGLVNALDSGSEKLWSVSVPGIPVVVRIISGYGFKSWICVGCEDGSILAMDGSGKILRSSKVNGRPSDLIILGTPDIPVAVITTVEGEIKGFQLK